MIPVVPAQHYFMGGIKVNLQSKTSMDQLYAIGETAATEFTEETDLPATHYWKVWFLPRELQKK